MYVAILDFIARRKSPLNHVNRKYLLPPLFFFYPFRRLWNTPVLHLINLDSFLNTTQFSPRFFLSFFLFFIDIPISYIRERSRGKSETVLFFSFLFLKEIMMGKRSFDRGFFSDYIFGRNVVYLRKKKWKICCKFNRYIFRVCTCISNGELIFFTCVVCCREII